MAGMFLFVTILSACQSPSLREAGDYGAKGLESGPLALSLAALIIEFEPDINNMAFLYIRLARQYYQAGKVDLGAEILRRSLVRIRNSPLEKRHGLLQSLGSAMIQLGYRNQGKELVKEAYDLIIRIQEDTARGWALGELIQTCFKNPEELGPLLREAVDYVFVLDDALLKVQILTDLAFRYQELNTQGRVSTVLQHVIIAAMGIKNDWYRAEAYARIASAWKAEGNSVEAERWVGLTFSALAKADISTVTNDERSKFLATLLRLADFNRFRELGDEIARLPDLDSRISVQLAVIGAYLGQGATGVFQALLAVQRLLNQVRDDDEAGVTGAAGRAAAVLVRLAELYQIAHMKSEAIQYADAAVLYLERHPLAERNLLRSRLAETYALSGEYPRGLVQMNLVDDPYVAAKTGVKLLDIQASLMPASASGKPVTLWAGTDALVSGALFQAQASTLFRESVLAGVISVSWQLGKIDAAADALFLLNDPLVLAGVIMDTWRAGEPGASTTYASAVRRLLVIWETKSLAR